MPDGELAMIHVVQVEPEIPPNTGNVILPVRANTGATFCIWCGGSFPPDDARMRRAGLTITNTPPCRCTTTGTGLQDRARDAGRDALVRHRDLRRPLAARNALQHNDAFVFGSEARGLSATVLADFAPERRLRLPMRPAIRSLNLSNAVAVTV